MSWTNRLSILPLTLVPLGLLLSACKPGQMITLPSVETFKVQSTEVVDYNAEKATVRISGDVNIPSTPGLSKLSFYTTPDCSGELAGQGLVGEFESSGLQLELPVLEESQVYAAADTVQQCYRVFSYKPDVTIRLPIFSKLEPTSPSRVTASPGIFGRIFPSTAVVRLYSDDACTNLVGTGSASIFEKTGIQIALEENKTTKIHAIVEDPLEQTSACTPLADYRHSNVVNAPPPQFVSSNPPSPTNATLSPLLKGTLDSTIVEVAFYSDAACLNEIGKGTAEEFKGSGINASIQSNQRNLIYAKSTDDLGDSSLCVLLTTFIHDETPPGPPSYLSASPPSPTRLTTFPRILGTAPSDSAIVRLYDTWLCLNQIGFGTRSDFAAIGVTANLQTNRTTSIYAKAVDAAGNASACTYMMDYRHNTIPPDVPIFSHTLPASPTNKSVTPLVFGAPSETTASVSLYKDEECQQVAGSGSATDLMENGIQVTVPENSNTSIYATASDAEGNVSACTFMTNFAHSDLPAPPPVFSLASPPSPTRITNKPYIVGTAPSTVSTITLYSDSLCTQSLGSATRLNFATSGILATLPLNVATNIYGQSSDVYGNQSFCTLLTTYVHNTIPPLAPTFVSVSPASPTNQTSTPVIKGTAYANPASPLPPHRVTFYDTDACVNKLGEGPPTDFAGAGIQIGVAENAVSTVYARSFDGANNSSPCTFLLNFVHNTLKPGMPRYLAASPGTPSYSAKTKIRGFFNASQDFMQRASVGFYTDQNCLNQIDSGVPADFEGNGIEVDIPPNATSKIYAASFNEIGNKSACSYLLEFKHSDIAPGNLKAVAQNDGAVQLNWSPDVGASPTPTYTVKRASRSGGPYTVVSSGAFSPSFRDRKVVQGKTYYYRVQASNITGRSQESDEVSVTVAAAAPMQASELSAVAGPSEVQLSWNGGAQNMIYFIYRAAQSGGPYTLLPNKVVGTNFLDQNLTNGLTYYYVVSGINPSGESMISNEARATPLPVPTAPGNIWLVPKNYSSDCGGTPGLHIYWLPTAYNNGYELYRETDGATNILDQPGVPYAVDCSPRAPATGFDGWNRYTVSARWGTVNSALSGQVSFLDAGTSNLQLEPGNGEIVLYLQGASGSQSVDIYRSERASGPFQMLAQDWISSSYTDSTVTNGIGYYYYIQARDGSDFVGWPSWTQGATPGVEPDGPSNLTYTVTDGTSDPSLTWSPPTHYSGFTIETASSPTGPFTWADSTASTQRTLVLATNGLYFIRVVARWGNFNSTPTNVVSFRKAPMSGVIATPGATSISITWNPVSGASGYRVERADSLNGPFSTLNIASSSPYVDTDAVKGQGHYYRVTPLFADGTEGQKSHPPIGAMRTDDNKPSGLTILAATNNSVTLQWTRVNAVTQYRLYVRATNDSGVWTSPVGTAAAALNSFTFGTLNPRTRYWFKVGAVVSGTEFQSDAIPGATYPAANPPTVGIASNRLDLSWLSAIGADSYNLERSQDRINFSTIATGLTATAYSDNDVTNGQLYFYRLVNVYPAGSVTSVSTAGFTPGVVPIVPSGLTVTDNSDGNNIYLSWTPVTGVARYNLYMATDINGPWTIPYSTVGASNGPVNGLTEGQTVYFRVSSLNGAIQSSLSDILAVVPLQSPAPPTAQYVSPTEVQVNWTSVPGAATYELLRSDDGQDFEALVTLTGTSYLDATATPNRNYYYRFQPKTAAGAWMARSGVSSPISTGVAPNKPTGVSLTASSTTSVTVQWAFVSAAIRYEIYRSTTSGSGYSLVGTVPSTQTSFVDTSVAANTAYYYVVRAINVSGVPSLYSDEAMIHLVPAPTGLAAVNNGPQVSLNWDPVAGATGYKILRADISGGPFGNLGTSATNSYNDQTTVPGRTYHYAVTATFAGGINSPLSSEVALVRTGYIDLQHAIELIDRGISSVESEARIFDRSMTSFNSNDYDGTVTYDLELVATNMDNADHSVELIDESGTTQASVIVPMASYQPLRVRSTIVLPSGPQVFRLKLAQTAYPDQLSVLSARIIITQTDATRTRIYVPLNASMESVTSMDLGAFTASTTSAAYIVPNSILPYFRNASSLSRLAEFNAWELEGVVAQEGGAFGDFIFRNSTKGQNLTATLTEIGNSTLQLASASINEGDTHFAATNENDQYEVMLRCTQGCGAGHIALYKMGLWIRLENLTKAQVAFRTSYGANTLMSTTYFVDHRLLPDLSRYTNPVVRHQATFTAGVGSSADIWLSSAGLSDFGETSLTPIAGTTQTFMSFGRTSMKSPPFSLPAGERILTSVQPNNGTSTMFHGSTLLIDVGP